MLKQILHESWTVWPVSNLDKVPAICQSPTPAVVPGCVHTDLLRAGKIVDPYGDRVESTLRWIGQTDWRYETTFTADAKLFEHERIDLAADGLDTVARIELNGQLIGTSEDMHVGLRFDVRPHLRPGENTLAITFASAELYAFAMEKKIGKLPFLNSRVPFNMVRKMACNFGWDWGPEFITCGIWRGIRLEAGPFQRIVNVLPTVPWCDSDHASVKFDINVVDYYGSNEILPIWAEIVVTGPDSSVHTATWNPSNRETFLDIPSPKQWWPIGYGDQPLYEVTVSLRDQNRELDRWSARIGLRTIELDTAPDDIGRKFVVKVNGKPIFCKGFNWIPDDCFLDRACEPGRVRERIEQALAANANMLRVWGGGIYETDEFYDICDELGVLVWQDFLFACAAYSEEEPFKSLVEREVRYNVARLSHHASLAIWNGCNENVWGYHDWGWKKDGVVKNRTWGLGYYFDLVPKLVKELDPSRPYWAASPWSGDYDVDNGLHPNLATHGNKHVWEAWFGENYLAYRRFEPRFCSEFGFQGPATYSSIAAVVPAEERDQASPAMRFRQKSLGLTDDGDRRNLRHLSQTFELPGLTELMASLKHPDEGSLPPKGEYIQLAAPGRSATNFDDLHYLLSLNQARALTVGVEWFRSRQPTCMGTLYWQLNDAWTGAMSWSAIDGDGRPKLLWFATRRFYAPTLLTIQPEGEAYSPGDPLTLFIIDDAGGTGPARVRVARQSFDGKILAEQEVSLPAGERASKSIRLDPAIVTPRDPSKELITLGGMNSGQWFFAADKQLAYPPPAFTAVALHEPGVTRLAITAQTLLRDIVIQVDRLDPAATISEQLVTLLPGEGFTFEIQSTVKLSQESLTTRPVFNCANYFGKQM